MIKRLEGMLFDKGLRDYQMILSDNGRVSTLSSFMAVS